MTGMSSGSNAVEVYRQRDTVVTVELPAPEPAGADYEAEIRVNDDPTSTKIADWDVDDSAATVTGVLTLSIDAGTITSKLKSGRMDIVRIISGRHELLLAPIDVRILNAPTVVGP